MWVGMESTLPGWQEERQHQEKDAAARSQVLARIGDEAAARVAVAEDSETEVVESVGKVGE